MNDKIIHEIIINDHCHHSELMGCVRLNIGQRPPMETKRCMYRHWHGQWSSALLNELEMFWMSLTNFFDVIVITVLLQIPWLNVVKHSKTI